MNVSFCKSGLTVLVIFLSASLTAAQSDDTKEKQTDNRSIAEKKSESVIDDAPSAYETNGANNWVGDVFYPEAVHSSTLHSGVVHAQPVQIASDCCETCSGTGGRLHSKIACKKSRLLGSLLHPCSKSKAVFGFDVEEVQYGANAGVPSFGVVSHGPWYNGPVFGPQLLKKGCNSCNQKNLIPRLGGLLAKHHVGYAHDDCQCEHCQGEVLESAPAMYNDGYVNPVNSPPPLESEEGDSTTSRYPLNRRVRR